MEQHDEPPFRVASSNIPQIIWSIIQPRIRQDDATAMLPRSDRSLSAALAKKCRTSKEEEKSAHQKDCDAPFVLPIPRDTMRNWPTSSLCRSGSCPYSQTKFLSHIHGTPKATHPIAYTSDAFHRQVQSQFQHRGKQRGGRQATTRVEREKSEERVIERA